VFNSIRKQNITLGELVAIQGLGGLGHLAVQCESSILREKD
jgi:D-arabinose 1-dehydrogenase-like Zn-dependent alcohol dehydrogenase